MRATTTTSFALTVLVGIHVTPGARTALGQAPADTGLLTRPGQTVVIGAGGYSMGSRMPAYRTKESSSGKASSSTLTAASVATRSGAHSSLS